MSDTSSAFAHPASILTLETFRLNGSLISLGDAITAPLGLTSARWQVMGAIAEGQGSLPVASLARNMGLVRQSVQRIVDELAAEGFVRFADNPHHKRAKLVQLTENGTTLFDRVNATWLTMADGALAGISPEEAWRCIHLLRSVRQQVEAMRPTNTPDLVEPEI